MQSLLVDISEGVGLCKSSESYRTALERVQQYRQLAQHSGEPAEEAGWFPSRETTIQSERGDA